MLEFVCITHSNGGVLKNKTFLLPDVAALAGLQTSQLQSLDISMHLDAEYSDLHLAGLSNLKVPVFFPDGQLLGFDALVQEQWQNDICMYDSTREGLRRSQAGNDHSAGR